MGSPRHTGFYAFIMLASIFAFGGCRGCEGMPEPQDAQASGEVRVVDPGETEGETGWWPSASFGPQGDLHVSYCDAYHGDLRYAVRRGDQWHLEAVITDGAVGKYTALAVDSKGGVGIGFYDQDKKYLRYAYRPAPGPDAQPQAWKSERIAWGLEVGMAAELRFDKNDQPNLFYFVPSGRLIHARRNNGEWTKEIIDKALGSFSVRIDAVEHDDGFWVSYVDWSFKDTNLRLARPNVEAADEKIPLSSPSPRYIRETVATELGPGWRSQIVFEGDEPLVLFTLNREPQLRLAYRSTEGWKHYGLIADVANFDAERNEAGEIWVAYEDVYRSKAGRGTIKFLKFKHRVEPELATVSRLSMNETSPAGQYLDLSLDAKGRPWLVYHALDIRGLKVFEPSSTSP